MRVLFWFCERLAWTPTLRTLDQAPPAEAGGVDQAVAAFIHVEPADQERASKVTTKLVKNCKWLAGKWESRLIVLHSFTHLGEEKADPDFAQQVLDRAQERLEDAGYQVIQTPYGHFNDLELAAPGHPLARIYKQF